MSYGKQDVCPCFTPGTPIATDRGWVPVETLKPGNRVITRDNGLQEIAWVGRRTISREKLRERRELAPIFVAAGAFGEGNPTRDMIVSPNHRFLVTQEHAPFRLTVSEALVAARHLIDHVRVRHIMPFGVSYIHFLCEQHEVVMAACAWTESFHPDDTIMAGLGHGQRREILGLFPEIAKTGASRRFPAARPIEVPQAS